MNSLSAFLSPINPENTKLVVSKRFLGADGEPEQWEIRALTGDEDEGIRRACTKRVALPGKKGQYMNETDFNDYLGKLAAACTVYPNLNDKELQEHFGAMGGDDTLKKMLTAGEYAGFIGTIQRLNGYDESMDELVDKAKN